MIRYKKLVITGATGHVGNVLCRTAIKRGYTVTALANSNNARNQALLKEIGIEGHFGDVCNRDFLNKQFQGADAVMHCAGKISIHGDKDGSVRRINIEGPKAILDAAVQQGVKRLVHFSSIHAIDYDENSLLVDETLPLATDHPIIYNRTKAQAEQYLLNQDTFKEVVVIAPTGVIGPHDYKPSEIGTVLLQIAHKQLPTIIHGGFNWVDVRDLCEGALNALEQGKSKEKYLLCGTHHSFQELSKMVGIILDKKTVKTTIPMWVAKSTIPLFKIYALFTKQPLKFTMESLYHIEHSNQRMSYHKAFQQFNYHPRPISETIYDTLVWAQQNKLL